MKRLVIAALAVFTLSSVATAQNENNENGKKFDKSEMIQKRTNAIVKRYGLSQDQASQLLELNKEYAGKLQQRRGNMQKRNFKDDKNGTDNTSVSTNFTPEQKAVFKAKRAEKMKEMKANREAYNAKLQTIMTPDQYTKYKEDMKERMQKSFNKMNKGTEDNQK